MNDHLILFGLGIFTGIVLCFPAAIVLTRKNVAPRPAARAVAAQALYALMHMRRRATLPDGRDPRDVLIAYIQLTSTAAAAPAPPTSPIPGATRNGYNRPLVYGDPGYIRGVDD